MSAISVVLADDELLLREAIMTLLCLNDDIEVVGTAQDGKEAIEVITRLRPDIAVLDLEMPKLDGLEVAAAILENIREHPGRFTHQIRSSGGVAARTQYRGACVCYESDFS